MTKPVLFSRMMAVVLAVCVLYMGLPMFAQTAHGCRNIPTIINIDYPGGFQTQPAAISNTGWITGGRLGTDSRNHCFLRSPGGSYTDCEPSGVSAISSFGWSINAAGQIAGVYKDSSGVYHGFLDSNGTFTTLDAPDRGTGMNQGTAAYDINPTGEIAGQSIDNNNVYHSWVWVSGSFTVFDAPGGGTGAGQGTEVSIVDGLNPIGTTVGSTIDGSNVGHGFVRDADGSFACTFDTPDAGHGSGQGTYPGGINQANIVEGDYSDSSGVYHAFVGPACGTLTEYDVVGAGTSPGQGTQNGNINALGEVVGLYVDSSNVNHGYVREPNGMITRFDAPGAGTGSGQGTFPYCNNVNSQVTGWYADNLGKLHGFLRSCN